MRCRNFEVMQYCKYLKLTNQQIKNILDKDDNVLEYAFIKHDKDNEVEEHYHIAIKFNNGTSFNRVANMFKVEQQYVSRVKAWKGILEYLTHETEKAIKEGKHIYKEDEVISSIDFKELKEKATNKNQFVDERKQDIINKIGTGEIREYNYYKHITIEENDKYRTSIERAFKYRIDVLEGEKKRSMQCVYIQGKSGYGKTTYAKIVAEESNYSYYISSGSNDVLDGYKGQDCIILDDMRSSVMGLSDLLKLLDNNTSSTVKSRYKNKFLECKMIIVTSVVDINTFFNNVFENENEPVTQFKRRFKAKLIVKEDLIEMYCYDSKIEDHKYILSIANPVQLLRKPKTDGEMLDDLVSMFNINKSAIKVCEENAILESDFLKQCNAEMDKLGKEIFGDSK